MSENRRNQRAEAVRLSETAKSSKKNNRHRPSIGMSLYLASCTYSIASQGRVISEEAQVAQMEKELEAKVCSSVY